MEYDVAGVEKATTLALTFLLQEGRRGDHLWRIALMERLATIVRPRVGNGIIPTLFVYLKSAFSGMLVCVVLMMDERMNDLSV